MLKTRIIAAALLAPPVLLLIYLGTPYIQILVLAAAVGMAWEWARLCAEEPRTLAAASVTLAIVVAVAAGAMGHYGLGLALALAGALGLAIGLRLLGQAHPFWLAAGVPYLAIPCLAIIWLRAESAAGAMLVIWLFLVIWATDSGAYFAGKGIGGPKLAPRISPKKTWAGLAGGMLAAGLVGLLGDRLLPEGPLWPLLLAERPLWPFFLVAAVIAALSQLGDLFESFAKRRFGVKDSGGLIPGHGGLLDRLDGLLVGALVLAGLIYWREVPS